MPELPEVENVKQDLHATLVGQGPISAVKLLSPKLRVPLSAKIPRQVSGKTVINISRRAKYILLEFDHGYLLSHLGMSGSWRRQKNGQRLKHDHVILELKSGEEIVYHDPRRFGILEWVDRAKLSKNKWLKDLGPEPFDEEIFTADYLWQKLKVKNSPIKTALMDQKLVVGLGNIYVNESLFLAGISPRKKSNRLSQNQCHRLHTEITKILKFAIESGGTTINDYRRTNGEQGGFQKELFVYDRAGKPCKKCENVVRSTVQAGRSSYWCPGCQN